MAYSWVKLMLILLDSEVSIQFNISALPQIFLAAVVHALFQTSIIMEASTFCVCVGGGGGGGGGGSWELARWGRRGKGEVRG